jgi:hypothetical protein
MFKHVRLKWALAIAVPVTAALTLAVSASATPPPKLSFGASNDGASAGWSRGHGSPIDLTLGSSPGSFAEITFERLGGTAVSSLSEPSFTTDNYNAGSPRFYITLSDGNSLWGYPSNSGLNGSDMAWAIDNAPTYMSWSQVQSSSEGSATVTGAFVIADTDQTAGTTDQITNLTFGGTMFN